MIHFPFWECNGRFAYSGDEQKKRRREEGKKESIGVNQPGQTTMTHVSKVVSKSKLQQQQGKDWVGDAKKASGLRANRQSKYEAGKEREGTAAVICQWWGESRLNTNKRASKATTFKQHHPPHYQSLSTQHCPGCKGKGKRGTAGKMRKWKEAKRRKEGRGEGKEKEREGEGREKREGEEEEEEEEQQQQQQ